MYEQQSERTMLSLVGVAKSYGEFTLGPLDLEIEPGYVVAVVGPNGSGKSTLFRMLMGLVHPDEGEVNLFGGRYPEDEIGIKSRIGYVPETSTGHDEMTAAEIGSFVAHWYPAWDGELYAGLLRRFELDADKRFDKLSKGMQRRLAFALAVARRPKLLLLDEPTDGVDPFARRLMLEEVSRYLERDGRTVLFATHVMEEVRRIADYVVFLHGGRFLGFHEKDALLEQWKTFWVDRTPEPDLPGLVSLEEGTPTRLVTRSPKETSGALENQGIGVVRSGTLELEEILGYLMRAARRNETSGESREPERAGGPR